MSNHQEQQDFFSSEAFRALLEAIEQQYGKIEYVTVCHLPDNPDEIEHDEHVESEKQS